MSRMTTPLPSVVLPEPAEGVETVTLTREQLVALRITFTLLRTYLGEQYAACGL